jgi:succinyl-CoA synthetase beta subunit
MNLHEYQAKEILKSFNVTVPLGFVSYNAGEAENHAKAITESTGLKGWAVKAQIHAGGRGKGGGVKIAKSIDNVKQFANEIIGMNLVTHQTGHEGKKVSKVLIEQNVYYPDKEGNTDVREYYISILLNRNNGQNIVMYSPKGGMDIEKVAVESPEFIFKEEIHPSIGILPFQARKIAFNLGLKGTAFKNMLKFMTSLYDAYVKSDATLIEINPVLKTSDNLIFAADAKVKIDDNALYRHKDYQEMRDITEEAPAEVDAQKHNLSFVKLNGNVGCMVNGAGLAMATMDIIKLSGGDPANFLDVGGGASPDTVEAGFRIILRDENVKAILLNIFGGIVRCDRVAQGVVDAYKSVGKIKLPVIVRLQGTNAEEGKAIIDNSGLKVQSAITLEEAAKLVQNAV